MELSVWYTYLRGFPHAAERGPVYKKDEIMLYGFPVTQCTVMLCEMVVHASSMMAQDRKKT